MKQLENLLFHAQSYSPKQKREKLAMLTVKQNILLGVYKVEDNPLKAAIEDYEILSGTKELK